MRRVVATASYNLRTEAPGPIEMFRAPASYFKPSVYFISLKKNQITKQLKFKTRDIIKRSDSLITNRPAAA